MATPIHPLIISGSRKSDGTVNAGGRVFLTQVGSANVAVTGYADPDKLSALTLNSGGYLLDNAGKAAIYVDQPCTVRVEDAAGVAVDSYSFNPSTNAGLVEVVNTGFTGVDPITGQSTAGARTYLNAVLSNLATSLGGTDGKYRGTYGTVDTNLKFEVEQLGLTPQRFGARGDGVTDDTLALAAMAAAQAASGLPVFFPSGTYRTSAAVTFGANTVIRGVGCVGGSKILCTNATQNGLVVGFGCRVDGICVTTNIASSGAAFSAGTGTVALGCAFGTIFGSPAAPYFATGVSTAGSCVMVGGAVAASTTMFTGTWQTFGMTTTLFGGGAVGANVFAGIASPYGVSSQLGEPAIYTTTDLANGGTVVPTIGRFGQPIAHQRIRATSAGGGTVNGVIGSVSTTQILVLECYNNSGGAFTFTLNAQYKNAGNPAPANGSRTTVHFSYNSTESIWSETGRATTT